MRAGRVCTFECKFEDDWGMLFNESGESDGCERRGAGKTVYNLLC